MRKTLVLCLTLVLTVAANAFAGAEARMTGKLIDGSTKKPIADGLIKYEAIEGKTVKQETKVKADGSFAVFVLDGTIRYKFSFSAPGYVPMEEVIKMKIGETMVKEVELFSGSVAAAAPGGGVVAAKVDPSVEAYNEGARLSNMGDLAAATAKFEEAVAAKPDLLAGWGALAKMCVRTKNYPRAIEAAKKVLDIDDTDGTMWAVLFEAYTATGDKANAAIAEKKMPANAGTLFNEAARLINAGDDAGAEKLLQQAIEMDPTLGIAYYELGMVYVRGGKSADAKATLSKYIEVDPKGKDVPTAREMLKYLQ